MGSALQHGPFLQGNGKDKKCRFLQRQHGFIETIIGLLEFFCGWGSAADLAFVKPMVHPQTESCFLAEYQQEQYCDCFGMPSEHATAMLGYLQRYCKFLFELLLFSAAVFGFFAAGGESFVGVGFGGDVIGVVAYVGNGGLDVLDIGAIGDIGDGGGFLLIVDVDLYDAVFVGHISFDAGFALVALDGRGFDHRGELGFCLGHRGGCQAEEEGEKKMDFFHI